MSKLFSARHMDCTHRVRFSVLLLLIFLCVFSTAALIAPAQDESLQAATQAYDRYDYANAVQLLQAALKKEPQSSEIYLMLARNYCEMEEWDAAITNAERAIAIHPNNSSNHEWLGRAYGEKADRAGGFSALSLAKKTHKELETAVHLDERNFSAAQALVEFDCSAPGIAGGGEDKARAIITRLAELDASEGHYAEGNCRRHKKDNATAELEFAKALASKPKSVDLVYDIGDHAMKHGNPELLMKVVEAGEKLNPRDPRGEFYRGVRLVLEAQKSAEAERLLRAYLKQSPIRTGYPRPAEAHYWIGRLYESQNNERAASEEYQTAVKLDAKYRPAREALKKIGKG